MADIAVTGLRNASQKLSTLARNEEIKKVLLLKMEAFEDVQIWHRLKGMIKFKYFLLRKGHIKVLLDMKACVYVHKRERERVN